MSIFGENFLFLVQGGNNFLVICERCNHIQADKSGFKDVSILKLAGLLGIVAAEPPHLHCQLQTKLTRQTFGDTIKMWPGTNVKTVEHTIDMSKNTTLYYIYIYIYIYILWRLIYQQ